MAFPVGAQTITLTGTFPVPVGGTARAGRIVLTPSATLVDATQKAIYSGGGTLTLDNAGHFTAVLLCTNDTDVQPTGWRWRVDEQPSGGPRRTYWIDLPSTLGPTVDLSTLAPVSAPDGTGGGSQTATPTGPAGGALTGTYPNPNLSSTTIASFDPAGAAATAQAAAAADATTKANTAQTAATSAAATDATAKVAAHTVASDPHGDRAAASSALAAHAADSTDVHGITNTAALETAAGAQAKADSAQTAATTAAASDATSKVTTHTGASDPHGDRAASATDATAKVSTHTAASDPHGDRASATTALNAHVAAVDPHGDRAYADNKFATQLDLTTLNGTVNTLSGTVTAIDGFLNDALNRVAAIEQGTAWLGGLQVDGPAVIANGGLTIQDGNAVVDSAGNALSVVDRGNTTSIAAFVLRTAGVDRWAWRMVGDGTNDLLLTDLVNSATVLRVTPGTTPEVTFDADVVFNGAGGGGGGSTVRTTIARITDGAIADLDLAAVWTIATTSVGTPLQCSIAAADGDRIRLDPDFMRNGAHFLDWALLDNAGVPAIYGTTRTSTPPAEGSPSMYPSTSFGYVQGSKQFTVGSGHISAGLVTIALAHQGTSPGKVYAHTTYPFELMLTNLGPEPV